MYVYPLSLFCFNLLKIHMIFASSDSSNVSSFIQLILFILRFPDNLPRKVIFVATGKVSITQPNNYYVDVHINTF